MTDRPPECRPGVSGGDAAVAEVVRPDFVELYLSCSAADPRAEAAGEAAQAAYAAMAEALAARRAVVVQERLFGTVAARDDILRGRREALAGTTSFGGVPPTFLEGRPCDGDGLAGIHLCAVAPDPPTEALPVEEIVGDEGPVGRFFERGGVRFAYLSGLAGTLPDEPRPAAEQAEIMFGRAARYLGELGFACTDVARTWIYLADILRWYDEFNAVRTAAYRRFGIVSDSGGRLPASTGIQARSPGAIECVMDLLAVQAAGGELTVDVLHNPLQNEAFVYGSSFSRAMEVITGGVRTVYISGTASIDEAGHTIHLGDAAGQIERTVRNIEALIGTRGLTLNDIRQATVFLKHPGDLSRFRELCADNAFGRLGVCMAADVCRADLLFEIDAVAAEG